MLLPLPLPLLLLLAPSGAAAAGAATLKERGARAASEAPPLLR